jgi:predicted PurR-regulated permease PerM
MGKGAHQIFQRFEGLPLQILNSLSHVVAGTLASIQGLFTVALNLVGIPPATFYFLRDIDHMRAAFPHFLPVSYRDWIMAKLGKSAVLAAYLFSAAVEGFP